MIDYQKLPYSERLLYVSLLKQLERQQEVAQAKRGGTANAIVSTAKGRTSHAVNKLLGGALIGVGACLLVYSLYQLGKPKKPVVVVWDIKESDEL